MGAVNKDLALFFEFLAQEGATAQFFENWVSCNWLYYEGSDLVASFSRWVQSLGIDWDSYIIVSFYWRSTSEGKDYWSDLNFKWLSYYGTVCK